MRTNAKLILIITILSFMVTSLIYPAKTNEFKNYGVQFNYPSDYEVEHDRDEDYVNIEIAGDMAMFMIQIFDQNLTDELEKIYIETFLEEAMKDGAKLISNKKTPVTIHFKDNSKKDPVEVKANYWEILTQIQEDGLELKLSAHVYIYNYGKKGYVFLYFHQTDDPKDEDRNIIHKSFTFLTK